MSFFIFAVLSGLAFIRLSKWLLSMGDHRVYPKIVGC